MKVEALLLIGGAGGTLILASPATAGFTGIEVVSKPNSFELLVCNVFATFDRPGQDRFLSAAGTPNSPMDVHVVGGTFYQNAFGWDFPPDFFVVIFPSLAYDSFVTIGIKVSGEPGGQPEVPLTVSTGWPGFGPNTLGGDNLFWANTPSDPNTNPFNPDYVNGNGQVLIGQFSTANGTAIAGMFRINVISNNVTTQLNVSFFHVPGPGALTLLAISGLVGSSRRKRS